MLKESDEKRNFYFKFLGGFFFIERLSSYTIVQLKFEPLLFLESLMFAHNSSLLTAIFGCLLFSGCS
jgi:hypothetical protein